MSQQPSSLQTILQNLPDIIKSLPILRSLFESRKREARGQEASETVLSIQDLNVEEVYVVDRIKTFRKKFRVIEAPSDEANRCAYIPSDQRADIVLETEDGNITSLQTPGLHSVEIPPEKLNQLPPDTLFWLESNIDISLQELVEQYPSQVIPTMLQPRDSTTVSLTNRSSFPVRDFEWPLPLKGLYPIYGFELQKGGKRVSNQLIQIRLGWMETLDNEELQKVGGYKHDDSILNYFNAKRKQGPVFTLSIRIDELKPKESVTLIVFHNPQSKKSLGLVHSNRDTKGNGS